MPKPKTPPPEINQTAIGDGNVQVAGDNNTVNVNQTFIQKVFKGINIFIGNVFRGDGETLDQRNRRILLNHVENFWVKGVLEKSLYGEVLIELGMKEEPGAVKTYPWGIKRENTGETLPASITMLEIFEQVGMGRSLLILGAPGSGKTTMLLELARQLIERARKDETEPIPMVFNLASWTEKQSLAQWLAGQLNLIYYVPRKTAPDWISGNKLFLLLDGLDEVRAESRAKCVETINTFRKEHGLTSLTVCSRSQDYAELKTRLFFDGAIEIQPLTSNQTDEYFYRFGGGLIGIRQALERDTVLREMAETPFFLSIMILAYRDSHNKEIIVSNNIELQRKQLFATYIERMFNRPERSKNDLFRKQDVLHWLSGLAHKMIGHHQTLYLLEYMQPSWIDTHKQQKIYVLSIVVILMIFSAIFMPFPEFFTQISFYEGLIFRLMLGCCTFMVFWGTKSKSVNPDPKNKSPIKFEFIIEPASKIKFSLRSIANSLLLSAVLGIIAISAIYISETGIGGFYLEPNWLQTIASNVIKGGFLGLVITGPLYVFFGATVMKGVKGLEVRETTKPNQGIMLSFFYWIVMLLITQLLIFFYSVLWQILIDKFSSNTVHLNFLSTFAIVEFFTAPFIMTIGFFYGGFAVIQHYSLRFILNINGLLPFRIVPFLDHCCDLIFLRRVGGGYIFIHRLLMEHFADMYQEQK